MGQRSKAGSRAMVDQKIETKDILASQELVWNRLRQIQTSNKIGSAYLFSGPPGCGKEGLAIKFSQMLNCENNRDDICDNCPSCIRSSKLQHENVKVLFPLPTPKKSSGNEVTGIDKKDIDIVTNEIHKKSIDPYHKIIIPKANRILIQSIRELRRNLYLKSESSGRKVVLVFDAHLLSVGQGEAANAFLKLLEEPPSNTTIVLVTDHVELLLPTIISRCQRIGFPRLDDRYIGAWFQSKIEKKEDLSFLVGLSRGSMHSAYFFISQSKKEITDLIKYLIDSTTKNDTEKWRKFIQDYAKLAKQEKDRFGYHFMLLKIWYQSVNRLQKGIDDPLHDTPFKIGMETFISTYPTAKVLSIVVDLEETVRAIPMNLYMPLVLTNLLLKTQKNLRQ